MFFKSKTPKDTHPPKPLPLFCPLCGLSLKLESVLHNDYEEKYDKYTGTRLPIADIYLATLTCSSRHWEHELGLITGPRRKMLLSSYKGI